VALEDATTLRFEADWQAPEGFLQGFRFRLLDLPTFEVPVASHDAARSWLRLQSSLPASISPGQCFELRGDEEAPILALRLATGTAPGRTLPPVRMRLATTRGTNALLERKGAPTLFLVTQGFADLLRIGTQQRPDLFALDIRKPEPLYHHVLEVPGRLAADGSEVQPLDAESLKAEIEALLRADVRCAAIALLHSWKNPRHEQELAAMLRGMGFEHVSCSAEVAPLMKILPRAETSIIDATLSPVIAQYLSRVQAPLATSDSGNSSNASARLHVMTSAGGLTRCDAYRAKDSLLSGPAAGVVGAARAARASGFDRLIAFDMGGTSTDVSRYDGDYDYVFEHSIGDAHLVAPALAIETVAAGGGSICCFEASELHVGPASAGADPGPACYGSGGPLTLTDVNLLLGRLDPQRFAIPIDIEASRLSFEALRDEMQRAPTAPGIWRAPEAPEVPKAPKAPEAPIGSEALLQGLLDIANERMAEAVRRISVRKGYDARDYVLVAFGGAGGQHACAVAAHLGIDTILVPQQPALLSALGLGHAVMERFTERQVLQRLEAAQPQLPGWIALLEEEARAALIEQGVPGDGEFRRRVLVKLRFLGQDASLLVEDDGALEQAFERTYRSVFGYWPGERPIEIESIRVVLAATPAPPGPEADAAGSRSVTRPARGVEGDESTHAAPKSMRAWFGGRWMDVPVHERHALRAAQIITGPALVLERYSVIVVEPGWRVQADGVGALVLRREGARGGRETVTTPGVAAAETKSSGAHPELVEMELFAHRFEAIARNMGEMLGRTAVSTNVKERLDFSCAVLDAAGELVVHAPHIPVHLGALGLCVRSVQEACPMHLGDVVVTNHPAFGGSHLPDVTVITPVDSLQGERLGYVASRAHHAEIGGTWPGSMPPTAKALAEGGVVLTPMYLFRQGVPQWEALRELLQGAPYPSRAVEENLADLRAAVAANHLGAEALVALAAAQGRGSVQYFMQALKERAAERMHTTLRAVRPGAYGATEELDDGTPLVVQIEIGGGKAHLDFTGTGPVHHGSLNATPAVVHSAVLYVLRLLVQEPLPLNEGLMQAVTLHIPPGLLNPPFAADSMEAPAICGGNVETSQRLVDVLLKALGLAACSQGTMNNVLFGDARRSYYETVCGGAGAGPGFAGASAVHTHMTNTRITDPEVLEHRHPVRLERFALRHDSGGAGRFQGGDGVIREITFLAPLSLSVLGQHRKQGPYGQAGGQRGRAANQHLLRADGSSQELGAIDGCSVQSGDRFLLETPGGGGYGSES
jgi:5-oxoprolinase (ATP-hydrolysing)